MNYTLPYSLEVCGTEYAIRTDYRDALDILVDLSDPLMDGQDRSISLLCGLYPDIEEMPREFFGEALKKAIWFMNGGEEEQSGRPERLMDWKLDFPRIAAPISKALGVPDIRQLPDLHWWTFLSGYMNIGNCLFSQIVAIRYKIARHKKLDKEEREFYNRNRPIIDIKKPRSAAEKEQLNFWIS